MPDSGYPPVPPHEPSEAPPTPPQAPVTPPSGPPQPQQPWAGPVGHAPYGSPPPPHYAQAGYAAQGPSPLREEKRRRTGLWWTLGILALVAVIVLSCTLPFVFLFSGQEMSPSFGEAVAVIRVDGVIAGTGDYYSGYITPEYFLDQLQQAEEDESVKAIVLRVDSPGGTVAASEEIAEYVRTCPKPVVVSVGDVNASGAYMISSQADEIWAMPGSSVGSIGVISQIPNVEGLLDKLGVDFQVITAGKYKDAGSPYRPLTDEERALIEGAVEEAYDQFIDIVASGREMERAEVEKLATGWTWSGEKSIELGLIDKIGTYEQALDAAADRGGIEGDYEIITYGDDFNELFGSLFTIRRQLDDLKALSTREGMLRESLPR